MNEQRRSKLRSKTGCLVCRQRRMKCDEKSPVCDVCRSSNRECKWPLSADLIDRRYASHSEWRYRKNSTKPVESTTAHLEARSSRTDSRLNPNSRPPSTHQQSKSATPDLQLCPPSPLLEAAVAERVVSHQVERRVSRHFVDKYFSLLLLPSCHPGFHHGWLAEIQQLMTTHKSLYYSVLACAASHIYLIDTTARMQDLSLSYYSNALNELSKLLASVSEHETHDGLLMSIMMLYINGFTSWDTDHDAPQHIYAATHILTLRVLNRAEGFGRLFDRLATESVMYRIFLATTGLWSDSTRLDYDFDRTFWDRAETIVDHTTFFPGTSRSFNSPVLGVPVSLFRIVLSLREYFRSGGFIDPMELERVQSEVADWEALLLCDENLRAGFGDEMERHDSQERYFRDASYLFVLAASLLLEQVLRDASIANVPQVVPHDSWQIRLTIRILEQYVDDQGWAKCFIGNWPMYTLGLFMESPEDRRIVREVFQRTWEVTKFAQVARFYCDLEGIWAASHDL